MTRQRESKRPSTQHLGPIIRISTMPLKRSGSRYFSKNAGLQSSIRKTLNRKRDFIVANSKDKPTCTMAAITLNSESVVLYSTWQDDHCHDLELCEVRDPSVYKYTGIAGIDVTSTLHHAPFELYIRSGDGAVIHAEAELEQLCISVARLICQLQEQRSYTTVLWQRRK